MRNNNVTKKLVSCNMQANKKRNIASVIAVALTSVMFTTVFTVGSSMLHTAAQYGAGMAAGAQGITAVVAILAMIFGSGYLIIHNIFRISVTRDTQFYGRLKTLGATQSQIKHLVLAQALKVCIIGIPAGLVVGYGIGAVLIPIVLVSLGSGAILPVDPMIFLGSALFSLITVMLSCAKPAKTAGKISPISAMKYIDSDVNPKYKSKRSSNGTNPRKMARNNMKRNKKRTALVVISISMGLALMNSFYVYHHSFDKDAYVDAFIKSDVAVVSKTGDSSLADDSYASGTITPESLQKMSEISGVEHVGGVWYTESEETINPDVLSRITAYYDEKDSGQQGWIEGDEDAYRQYLDLKKTGKTTVSVYGMDAYVAAMGDVYLGAFDAELFDSGNYVIGYGIANNGEGSVHYDVGDMINIQGSQYELMALIDPASTVRGNLHSDNNKMEIDYVISSENFKTSFSQDNAVSAFLDTDQKNLKSIVSELNDQYPDMMVNTRMTYEANFKAQTLAVSAMGYALGLIMALIGILNFANTMLTAIIARKHEFTMLESIGMTKRQLKEMLVSEGLSYVLLSLVLSVFAAVFIASTYIQESVSTSWVANYNFTLLPFAVIIPILIAIAVAVPVISFRETQKESLVERLRS